MSLPRPATALPAQGCGSPRQSTRFELVTKPIGARGRALPGPRSNCRDAGENAATKHGAKTCAIFGHATATRRRTRNTVARCNGPSPVARDKDSYPERSPGRGDPKAEGSAEPWRSAARISSEFQQFPAEQICSDGSGRRQRVPRKKQNRRAHIVPDKGLPLFPRARPAGTGHLVKQGAVQRR